MPLVQPGAGAPPQGAIEGADAQEGTESPERFDVCHSGFDTSLLKGLFTVEDDA